ncbi:MAG TPA: FkbM family methyltransferase [Gemmatimonadaceae bacterium]|nr:FkbM family methyltransferase [Gemmatimonadaceae bacterium]
MLRSLLRRLPHGRARAARWARHLYRHPFVDTVEPAELDIRLWINPRDCFQAEIWVGAYQPHVVRWIRNNVQTGDTVLCLGLHVGYVAALCRRLAGPTGHVFSAEPDAHAREFATRNLGLGDERDAPIDVFPGGFGSAESSILLYQSRVAGHSSFAAPHQPDRTVEVQVQRADIFLGARGVTAIDVLVLDVEGWELEVLRGLEGTLGRSKRLRGCVELSRWALADASTTAPEVLSWLAKRGVSLHHLAGDDWATTPVASAKQHLDA